MAGERSLHASCFTDDQCAVGAECKRTGNLRTCEPIVRADLNALCTKDSECCTGLCEKRTDALSVLNGKFGADLEHIKGQCKLDRSVLPRMA